MDAALTAIGGTTLSAGLADSQALLNQLLGVTSTFGTDSVSQFAAAYQSSGGGPTLTLLGFNPFQILAAGEFHTLYWAAITAFLGIMAVIAFQHVLNGRYAVRGRHPLNGLLQVYFRLTVGVLLIANVPLLYGILMTINRVVSDGIQSVAAQPLLTSLQSTGVGPLTLAQARADSIRKAAARRVMALYPAGASRAEMVQVGEWYNAAASAVNGALGSSNAAALPTVDASGWNDPSLPDDRVIESIGRSVVRYFPLLVAELGSLSPDCGPLSVGFPAAGGGTLALLSAALANDDAQAAQALALPSTPSSAAQFEAARQSYSEQVLTDTLAYLDAQIPSMLSGSPSLAARVKAWFSEAVDQAAAAAGGFLSTWRQAIDWVARSIGVTLTRMVAFLYTAGCDALIELELFMLVLTMPLWLLPATEEAFHGVLRSLVALTLAAPAYQFIMLFVDALMAAILRLLVLGPAGTGSASPAALAGSAASGAAAILAIAGTGGEVLVLATVCYLCAYLFLAIYVAFKSPKLVAITLKGAGAAAMFMQTFATGLVAGAATAAATASAAAGIGAGSAAKVGGALAGASRSIRRPPPRPIPNPPPAAAAEPAPPEPMPTRPRRPMPRWAPAAGFGVRTFVECLGASSPAEGYSIAFKALEAHRKQEEKRAQARHKAERTTAPRRAPRAR